MAVLTRADDMTRLRGEIAQLHDSLGAFVEGVKNAVAPMLAGFRKAHAGMAADQRKTFAANERERVRQAEKDLAGRAEFVSGLKKQVDRLRNELAAENAAAHKAWFGSRRATTAAGGGRAAGRRSKAKAGAGTR